MKNKAIIFIDHVHSYLNGKEWKNGEIKYYLYYLISPLQSPYGQSSLDARQNVSINIFNHLH